jgi:predicted NUDIX family NTP pyrophosphohydrolase
MSRRSAGILLYRTRTAEGRPRAGAAAAEAVPALEVLLVHPGGPFWARKDLGAWSIPKGEYGDGDDPLQAALREFEEETGWRPPGDRLLALGTVRQRGGKQVTAWAAEATGGLDLDPAQLRSNTFTLEWPPRSGQLREFPEVDRAGWFDLTTARAKLVGAQAELLDRLGAALGAGQDPE